MKRAIIITGKQVQDHEFIYPYYRLQEEGFDVSVAIRGNLPVLGNLGTTITPTRDIAGISPNDYEFLVLPGGAKALEYLRQDQEILNFITAFDAMGKTIACICHGSQLLISAKVVKGRRVSGYYSIKDDLVNAGALYVDEPAVVDGNLVTTAHYKHMHIWMRTAFQTHEKRGEKRWRYPNAK